MKISSAGPLKGSTTTGVTPDFTIFTSAMEIDSERENVVRMIGSSTERDLHGDTMAISALTDMSLVEPGLVIWLNHDYELPGSLFGSLLEKPELRLKDGIADLHIVSSVEMSNPNAVSTYGYIKNGTRLGCSIGCMILECEIDEENDDGYSWWPPLIITHVLPLEWSVVGIPANQRSWVENAIKGLFDRSLSSGKVDEALRLAPAMKSLWSKDFSKILKGVEDASLKKELEAIPARISKRRVEWDPHQKTFMMNQKGITVPLDRKDIPAFMAKGSEAPRKMIGWDPAAPDGSLVVVDAEKLLQREAGTAIETKEASEEPLEPLASEDTAAESVETEEKETDVDTATTEEKEVTPAEEEPATQVEEAGEEITLQLTDDQGKAVSVTSSQLAAIKVAMDTQPPVTISATIPVLPADVQLFNLLAERLGQSSISLDSQGQIIATKAFPELSPESVREVIAKALDFGETIKAGSEFNKKNQQTLQSLHNSIVDMCKSQFHPCEEMDDGSDDEGDDKKSYAPHPNSFFPKEVEKTVDQTLSRLFLEKAKIWDEVEVKSEIGALRKDLGAFVETLAKHGIDPKAFKDLQGKFEATQRQLSTIETKTKDAEAQLGKLANVPLGQPTLLKRGIQDNGDTVTHQDFKALSSTSTMNDNERRWSLDEALKATVVVPRTLSGGETMNYRKWPDGVGGSVQNGVRPALTGTQRTWMHPAEMLSYNDGNEAAVPCYDDPLNVPA